MNRLVLRLYPRAWRERYGDELLALMEDEGAGTFDVARAALAERLRIAGVAGPHLVVLAAWGLFTLAGGAYAKWAEHWDTATPQSARHLPQVGYDVVLVGAELGTLSVVIGALLTARHVLDFFRAGGWSQVRGPVTRALVFSAGTVTVLAALALWAHHLSNSQRNGANPGYGILAVLLGLLVVGSIASWVAAAVSIARRLKLGVTLLRIETILAGCATLAMAAMTAGTTIWWIALARAAPGFLGGAAPLQMVVIALAMLVATTLAATGPVRAFAR